MKKLILLLLILFITPVCRPKKHIGEESPFRRGFEFIPWGASESTVDSALVKDSTWKKVSRVDNSETGGKILVMRGKEREYFLEFDRKDRFFMMNYISDRDNMDTVQNHLKRYYGEPEQKNSSRETYQERSWRVEADSVHLEIQMLITQHQYALRVINKNIK